MAQGKSFNCFSVPPLCPTDNSTSLTIGNTERTKNAESSKMVKVHFLVSKAPSLQKAQLKSSKTKVQKILLY